jgi:hypothetical protein
MSENKPLLTAEEKLKLALELVTIRDMQLAEHEAQMLTMRTSLKKIAAMLTPYRGTHSLPAHKISSAVREASMVIGTVLAIEKVSTDGLKRLFTTWLGNPAGAVVVDAAGNIIVITQGDEKLPNTLEEYDAEFPDYAPHTMHAWYLAPVEEVAADPTEDTPPH